MDTRIKFSFETDLLTNMWPPTGHSLQESDTFFKSHLCLFAECLIFCKAMLEIDSRNNCDTVPYSWVGDLKSFMLHKVEEVQYPAAMQCKLFE